MSHEISPKPAPKKPAHVPWRAIFVATGFTFSIFFFPIYFDSNELTNALKISGITSLVVFLAIIEYNHTYRYWENKDIKENITPFILVCVSYLLMVAVVFTPWLYTMISLGMIGIMKSISIVPPWKQALLFRNTKRIRRLLPWWYLTIPFVDHITIVDSDTPMLQWISWSHHDKAILNITNHVRYSFFSCQVSDVQYDFRITYGIPHRYAPHISNRSVKENISSFIERYTNTKNPSFLIQTINKTKIEQEISEMISEHFKIYFEDQWHTYIALKITEIRPC